MNPDARQRTQPGEPLFSQRFTGGRRHLPDGGPQGLQFGRLTGKFLERPGCGKHFVRIANHAWPAEIANLVHNLHVAGTSVRQIAAVKDQVRGGLPQILQNCLKGSPVAVDIGYHCDAHLPRPLIGSSIREALFGDDTVSASTLTPAARNDG